MRLVQIDEIAKCDREFDLLVRVKWIEAERIFQACNDERKTQRVEARIQKLQPI